MKAPLVTRVICGRRLKLRKGLEYIASAPLAAFGSSGREKPVTISIWLQATWPHPNAVAILELGNFTRESAGEFLRAFNNRRVSFLGRKWNA